MDPPPCNAPSFIRTLPTGILEDAHFGLSQIFKIAEQALHLITVPMPGEWGGSSQAGSSSMQYPFIFELSQIFKSVFWDAGPGQSAPNQLHAMPLHHSHLTYLDLAKFSFDHCAHPRAFACTFFMEEDPVIRDPPPKKKVQANLGLSQIFENEEGASGPLKCSNSGMACSILNLKAIFDIYVSRALISLLCILELSGLVREIFFLTSFPGFLERRAINKNL